MENQQAILLNSQLFAEILYSKMKAIFPAVSQLAYYEFRYGLNHYQPAGGWDSITLNSTDEIEDSIQSRSFFESIQIEVLSQSAPVLDPIIIKLCQMLFVGLVSGVYTSDWIFRFFTFDIRGFFFLIRTTYFSPKSISHLGSKPYQCFEQKQAELAHLFEIGYQQYQQANAEVDQALMRFVGSIIEKRGTPILLTFAGPTAAGKTEIVARLADFLVEKGYSCSTLEMDHFNKDRVYRDRHKQSIATIHFDLFQESMEALNRKEVVFIPQYDFYTSQSSHDENSQHRAGKKMLKIEPADVMFLEGNFPFHLPELNTFPALKIVYLAADDVRLRRKWKRDIDLRKKYQPLQFINRYFRTQFIRAEEIYRPFLEICDIAVETTEARLWVAPALQAEVGEESK